MPVAGGKISRDDLIEAVEIKLQDLPALPTVVLKLLETMNKSTTSASDVGKLIASDQALSARVLRLVNSSFYGNIRTTCITRATVIIGFNAIRNVATAISMGGAFKATKLSTMDRERFWEHSVGVASLAQTIACHRKAADKQTTEEAFVGGLLHDLGKLFFDQYFPEQYAEALDQARQSEQHICDAEKATVGMGHTMVGKRIAESWNLPPSLVSMIAMHHQPSLSGVDCHEFVSIVHAADVIARRLEIGDPGDGQKPKMDWKVMEELGYSTEEWAVIESEALATYETIREPMVSGLS